jgi:DNA-binding MarR family transcriptional regulator
MFINKSTARILGFFVGHITETFALREVARTLGMQASFVHRAIQPLIKANIIKRDKHKNLFLNYKLHHETLIFAEYLRRDILLKKHKEIKLFKDEVMNKINLDNFILIVFGSIIKSSKPRDVDILLILPFKEDIAFYEKFLSNIAANYNVPFEERVIDSKSVYDMLSRRDENNIINEILNKHIILYGAEFFYRILKNGR